MGRFILVVISVLSAFAELTSGGVYRIIRAPSSYEIWRQKRQSHPLATQVRIPEVAFADTPAAVQGEQPPSSIGAGDTRGLLEIADYLTPPAPPADGAVAATGSQQGDKWDLGYDANDLLVPPPEQAREYDTLKIFTLVPNSAGPLLDTTALENPENPGQQESLQQQDNKLAGTNSREVLHPGQIEQEQRQEQPKENGPVYTYVKTDRQGHFKWGVRQGH